MRQHVYTMFISNNCASIGKTKKSQNIMKMVVGLIVFIQDTI